MVVTTAASDPIAKDPSSTTVCAVCQCSSPRLKRCQRCRSVFYCSVECQTFDWKQGHRWRCAPNEKEKQARRTRQPNLDIAVAPTCPPTVVQQSYQELLQLIQSKPLLELHRDYHKVSDHIRFQEEERNQKARIICEKSTNETVSVPPSPSLATAAPISSVGTPPNAHLPSSSPSTSSTIHDDWKWSIEHLANLNCLQWILQPPKSPLLPNELQHELQPDRARISSVRLPDQPQVVRLVFEYNDDCDTSSNGYMMNCLTRIAIELPVNLAPSDEKETTTVQCLDQNRSLCIRWSYVTSGLEKRNTLLDYDFLDGGRCRFPPHPWLACRHCRSPFARLQAKVPHPIASADTESSSSPPPIDTILSLPSGHFQELQDYLVCYDEGPTSIDFQNDSVLLPPAGTIYENETLYVMHSANVSTNALCLLSLPTYGANGYGITSGRAVTSVHSKWLSEQSWLQGSPEWSCGSVSERKSDSDLGFDQEGEFTFFNHEEQHTKITHCVACSFCASVIGFTTDNISPTAFERVATATASPVTAYQFFKHHLISLAAERKTADKSENISANLSTSETTTSNTRPSDAATFSVPQQPPIALSQTLLSISQFMAYELIRFAETKAIFTFVVICVDETRIGQSSDYSSPRMKPDANDDMHVMTTSILRLRLFHWNTMVASSDSCTRTTTLCSDLHRPIAKVPIHESSQSTTDIAPVPDTLCVPKWNRRVKILYEANEFATKIDLGTLGALTISASVGTSGLSANDEGMQNKKNTLAVARMMKKRWDVCCPQAISGMPRSYEQSSSSAETSNVVRFYLSRSEWNELCQELSYSSSQHNSGMEDLQSQLASSLNSAQQSNAGPEGAVNRGNPDDANTRRQLSGMSFICIL
jgi:MYND finger